MGVSDVIAYPFLGRELDLVRSSWRQSVPLLGICLGAQLVAAALGGAVQKAPHRSLGFLPVSKTPNADSDPIFSGWCATDLVLRWHQDTFTPPPGSVVLMTAENIPNQAFRFGDRTWGVQFHIEPDRGLLEDWVSVSTKVLGPVWHVQPEMLLTAADAHLPHQQVHARATFAAFARVCATGTRPPAAHSP
jgi:GMP synthase (glutamine-hydrolysing)